MNARIGINVPQDVEEGFDVARLRTFVQTAEQEGYDSFWVSEGLKPKIMDPLALLNFVAAASQRATIGVAVLLTAYRAPLQLARELASLDQLSGGRLIIGVGLGDDRQQYARLGLDVRSRAERYEAGVRLLQELMSSEFVDSQNSWWDLYHVQRPLPSAQQPCPPIWFGGTRPPALARAVRLGEGWIGAGATNQEAFIAALALIRTNLERSGRDPERFTVAKRVYLHVDNHHHFGAIQDWFEDHYGRAELAADTVIRGTADDCAERLTQLIANGVDTLILHPMVDMFDQMQTIAQAVIPQIRTGRGSDSTTMLIGEDRGRTSGKPGWSNGR